MHHWQYHPEITPCMQLMYPATLVSFTNWNSAPPPPHATRWPVASPGRKKLNTEGERRGLAQLGAGVAHVVDLPIARCRRDAEGAPHCTKRSMGSRSLPNSGWARPMVRALHRLAKWRGTPPPDPRRARRRRCSATRWRTGPRRGAGVAGHQPLDQLFARRTARCWHG